MKKLIMLFLIAVFLISGCYGEREVHYEKELYCNERYYDEALEFVECIDWCNTNEDILREADYRDVIDLIDFECNYEIDNAQCCVQGYVQPPERLKEELFNDRLKYDEYLEPWNEYSRRCME